MLTAVREVQVPLIAALLLGASLTKVARMIRTRSVDEVLGPTALFPMRLRKPLAVATCAIEFALGVGLVVTAGGLGGAMTANCVRLGAGLMFLVATSALIELRTARPDVGCGCFGDFSTAPVSGRTMARSAFLALAALSTVRLAPITQPRLSDAIGLLVIMVAELVVLGALSPELGEGLIRLGYSEPCELRAVPAERTMAALRRSKPWRRHSDLVSSLTPVDVWRELCWRYVVYPASYPGRASEVVFAVFLQQRRPAVHAVLVDTTTGERLPWPLPPDRHRRLRRALRLLPGLADSTAGRPAAAHPDMPVSSDL